MCKQIVKGTLATILRAVLESKIFLKSRQYHWKVHMHELFFYEVTSKNPATLLKMNSSTRIFKEFCIAFNWMFLRFTWELKKHLFS